MSQEKFIALTIAGSDPSGGAGIQADLKTFHQFGVYGMSVISLVTAQNSQGIQAVQILDADFIDQQLQSVLSDFNPHALKVGAIGNKETIDVIASQLEKINTPRVIDPIICGTHQTQLMDPQALELFKKRIIPCTDLITPNIPEAEQLSGQTIKSLEDMQTAAKAIQSLGAKSVLIKGGHFSGDPTDILLFDGQFHSFEHSRIETPHTHGTGCTLSAAITACLAQGQSLFKSVSIAKEFITNAIKTNPQLGKGSGPVNHHAPAFLP